MAVSAQPSTLDAGAQALVGLWAVKTGLLLELAVRQLDEDVRTVQGYVATAHELAWLWKNREPPPRSMVWIGCWNCEQEVPLNYEPSGADLPTRDGVRVSGHLATFTLGFAAFQLFTVDFLAAEVYGADVWNIRPPSPLDQSLIRIWPPQLTVQDVDWPPPAFRREEWRRIVTWDDALRSKPRRPMIAPPASAG